MGKTWNEHYWIDFADIGYFILTDWSQKKGKQKLNGNGSKRKNPVWKSFCECVYEFCSHICCFCFCFCCWSCWDPWLYMFYVPYHERIYKQTHRLLNFLFSPANHFIWRAFFVKCAIVAFMNCIKLWVQKKVDSEWKRLYNFPADFYCIG